ncbi:helix-turn-helix domain-containing protein [Pseudobacillus badius]|uniref:helix-turn-helix domain-containing protein n=1 Tax=Bacillus badius TaxID=1455 RepID=UPI003CF5C568
MLNFKNYFYKEIGSRIKKVREEMGFKQHEFVAKLQEEYISIDRFMLSHIENGRAYKKKNPYLLTDNQIYVISKLIKKEPKELIFGNVSEREDTVKLILLAIIINGAKYDKDESGNREFINPFVDTKVRKTDREKIAKRKSKELVQKGLEEFLRLSTYFINNESADRILYLYNYFNSIEEVDEEVINECMVWFEENLPFFTNVKHLESMENLLNESDEELEYHSNLLIKLLIGNSRFAQLFMQGLSNINQNQIFAPDLIPEESKIPVADFINNSNQFGGLAVDFKNAGFAVFVKAFTEMWERNNEIFIDYFNKHLFNVDLSKKGLKIIDDEFIHHSITSNEFSKILYDRIETERYEMETMKGHNTFDLYIQSIIIKNEIELKNLHENDLFKYVNNMIETNNAH